jgi:acyl-CoA synthetase (AMP-forming)/AMP-acid ligase II
VPLGVLQRKTSLLRHRRGSTSSIPAQAIQKETHQPRGAAPPSANLATTSMSYSTSAQGTLAVATALAKLGVRPGEQVLIMLPDGPGFAQAFAGIIEHHALPLPVNPLLTAPDITTAATKTGAGVLVTSLEQIHTLTDLGPEPPVLIDGAQGPWAAVLKLCSVSNKPTRKRVVLLPHDPSTPTTNLAPPPRRTGRPPA